MLTISFTELHQEALAAACNQNRDSCSECGVGGGEIEDTAIVSLLTGIMVTGEKWVHLQDEEGLSESQHEKLHALMEDGLARREVDLVSCKASVWSGQTPQWLARDVDGVCGQMYVVGFHLGVPFQGELSIQSFDVLIQVF